MVQTSTRLLHPFLGILLVYVPSHTSATLSSSATLHICFLQSLCLSGIQLSPMILQTPPCDVVIKSKVSLFWWPSALLQGLFLGSLSYNGWFPHGLGPLHISLLLLIHILLFIYCVFTKGSWWSAVPPSPLSWRHFPFHTFSFTDWWQNLNIHYTAELWDISRNHHYPISFIMCLCELFTLFHSIHSRLSFYRSYVYY